MKNTKKFVAYYAFGGENFFGDPIDPTKQVPKKVTKNDLNNYQATTGTTGITGTTAIPLPNSISNLRKIYKVQPGVSNDKYGSGYYLYYNDPHNPAGFDYEKDREFVSNDAFNNVVRTSPAYHSYLNASRNQIEGVAQYQDGGAKWQPENTTSFFSRVNKLQQGGQIYTQLSPQELEALAHQQRGSDNLDGIYMFKEGVKNEIGRLTPNEQIQLKNYMDNSSTLNTFYQTLPNILGDEGVSNIPENSRLRNKNRIDSNDHIKQMNLLKKQGYQQGGQITMSDDLRQSLNNVLKNMI